MRATVCFSCAANYHDLLVVALGSFRKHHPAGWDVEVWDVGLTPAQAAGLRAAGAAVVPAAPETAPAGCGGTVFPAARARCDMLARVPGPNRVMLYLDADLVVLAPVGEMVARFLRSGHPVGMAAEAADGRFHRLVMRDGWRGGAIPPAFRRAAAWAGADVLNTGVLLAAGADAAGVGAAALGRYDEYRDRLLWGEQTLIGSLIRDAGVPVHPLAPWEHCYHHERFVAAGPAGYAGPAGIDGRPVVVRHFCGGENKAALRAALPALPPHYAPYLAPAPPAPAGGPAPAVSVVMPAYNGAEFVGRAVRSVLAQTFPGWELVAVDDASADATPAVLAGFAAADPRVRVVRHAANRGPAAARNTALRAARGDWVCYLDHDDEFDPEYLARVWENRDRADVLLFRYLQAEGRPGHPGVGTVRRYDPGGRAGAMFAETIAVPLGVAHRRDLLARAGGFDESLWRDEDGDLWRRFAAAGARFLGVPADSGVYHVRADSLARAGRPAGPPAVAPVAVAPVAVAPVAVAPVAVAPVAPPPAAVPGGAGRPRVLFASWHAHLDPSSGAAVSTRDLFDALAARGWACAVVTGPQLDDPAAPPLAARLAGLPGVAADRGTAGGHPLTAYRAAGRGYPVATVCPDPGGPSRPPTPADAAAFRAVLAEEVARFRPDVVLTYGGDPASRSAVELAGRAGAAAVFWLHNFAYTDGRAFAGCAAVVVPSACARDHYKAAVGVDTVALPPVLNPARVVAPDPAPKYLTLVNPEPTKGVFWAARLLRVLGSERPDVPVLVVEGRGKVNVLGGCGVDLSGVTSVRRMRTTPDPRKFYKLAKVVLMPSLWRESFGRVAAEALLNGVPVVASDRGALPEVVGAGGLCLPIPAAYTPASRTPPSAAEVRPWADAVLRLWDDPAAYAASCAAARAAGRRWHPDVTVPLWEAFLAAVAAGRAARPG